MAETGDYLPLQSKHKAISALLPYAVSLERDGRPEMLIAILRAATASRMRRFVWRHVRKSAGVWLSSASPDAILLLLPHVPCDSWIDMEGLVQRWVAAASTVAYTEEVGQNVVNALLRIASEEKLVPHIPIEIWSWLTKRPSLPPICPGHHFGTNPRVIEAVAALKDVEILKSYLLLVWSEWSVCWFNDNEMSALILENFGGVGMGHHRADLIQRLDHVLGQFDCGLEHLKLHDPQFDEGLLWWRKDQYQELRKVLLEMNLNAISRTSHLMIVPLCMLTPVLDIRSIPHNVHVCAPSLVSIIL